MVFKEIIKLPVLNEYTIRPCYAYGEEFDECITLKGRFHQYFIYGHFLDCSQWQKDYENCLLWKNHRNKKACEELINSETKRRHDRLKGYYKNDIWVKRDEPPKNWNIPLPDWMQVNNKNSDLQKQNSNLNSTTVNKSDLQGSSICSIL